MVIIPTTDALNEPTVMRQIRKLAEYTEKNFSQSEGTAVLSLITYIGYYGLFTEDASVLVNHETYYEIIFG